MLKKDHWTAAHQDEYRQAKKLLLSTGIGALRDSNFKGYTKARVMASIGITAKEIAVELNISRKNAAQQIQEYQLSIKGGSNLD